MDSCQNLNIHQMKVFFQNSVVVSASSSLLTVTSKQYSEPICLLTGKFNICIMKVHNLKIF